MKQHDPEDRSIPPPANRGLYPGSGGRTGAVLCLPLAVILLGWYAGAWSVEALRGTPFPQPHHVVARLAGLLAGRPLLGHSIGRHVADSFLRWIGGFSLAAVAGLGFGLAAGWWRVLQRAALPIVHILHLIPGLAWIPVALLLFGIGTPATVFMIAMTAFPPIVLNVAGGVRCIDASYVRAARMLGASRAALFLRVLIPGALPAILNGLRVGLGNGWRVLVAGEMVVGTGTGLGYAIIQARWTLDYTAALVCVLIICLVGLAMEHLLFAPLERRMVRGWGLDREEPRP